ncbi:hypothetical protein FRB98_004511 [Tulasnella sp. 332]|nr:hypothetical protein FRB98_004511 [Tulasnella sp. 332]
MDTKRAGSLSELTEDVPPGLDKVYARHGRVDLVPMPSDDPQDPYNWSSSKKHFLLLQIAFHAMMGPFLASAAIPGFLAFVEDFDVSITQASYFVSVQIIFLGVSPLFWGPVANRIGRRPVYLISTLGAAICTFVGAYCHSYGTLMITRVFSAIMVSPPQAIGSSSVKEMFFLHERGQKMGIWLLLVTLGPPTAPFIFGFVVQQTSWHWIFWIISIVYLIEFVLYFFFGPETLFDRRQKRDEACTTANVDITPKSKEAEAQGDLSSPSTPTSPPAATPTLGQWRQDHLTIHRWDTTPWSHIPIEVIKPLAMIIRLPVVLPALAYAICFTFTAVLMTVEIPSLLGVAYRLDAQQDGLQFIAAILGCVLGEPLAGWGSDRYMAWRQKRGTREPEMRLWLSLPGFLLAIVGMIIFGVQLQNTEPRGKWNITPDIGTAIAFFGLQLVSTVCVTYAVESQSSRDGAATKSASAGGSASASQDTAMFVMLLRQTFAFTGPFYFNDLFARMGAAKASGLLAGLVGGASFLVVATMIYGKRWRTVQEDRG